MQKRRRRWKEYETSKESIIKRVARSGAEGKAAAKMYEHEIRQLCRKLGI